MARGDDTIEDKIKHIGETHGIYTIVDVIPKQDGCRYYKYKCICNVCGYEISKTYPDIAGNNKVIYNCLHTKRRNKDKIKRNITNKRIKSIHKGMCNRCYNTSDRDYKYYGAKGIKVCDEWIVNPASFEKWSLENGYNENLTIDRTSSEKGYSPDNCQWISHRENSRKAGTVNWITLNGETLSGRQWSERFNLGINRVNSWIKEYGIHKTKALLLQMLEVPPSERHRNPTQTWFDVYEVI